MGTIRDFFSKKNDMETVVSSGGISNSVNVEASTELIYGRAYGISYDGEKSTGEVGPVVEYAVNYYALATRSWKIYLDSEIAKTVLDKYTTWIIGKGLRLDSSPIVNVLESEGVSMKAEEFNDIVEARFNLYSKSKRASYSGMKNLNEVAKEAFRNAKIGGDVLVILRVIKGNVKIQLIDGTAVRGNSVNLSSDQNRIVNGVEIDSKGRHVRYHVSKFGGGTAQIKAWSSDGMRMAFLVKGSEYRISDERGLPLVAASIDGLAQMARYKEASVGGAEERSKIPYVIEHDNGSDGENPMTENIINMVQGNQGDPPMTMDGEKLANKVAVSTNKTVLNMPVGSKLSALDGKQEIAFKEFYGTNAEYLCGAIGIPPNVAFSMYNDSFSASRAATKDWEHTMEVERDDFDMQFYTPVYLLWFHVQVLTGKIKAPDYLKAKVSRNHDVVEAMLNHRVTGANFPHIDPVKEVMASRLKLGKKFDNVPLSTLEKETESLFGGDSKSNVEQASRELDHVKSSGIDIEDVEKTPSNNDLEKDD